MQLQTLDVPNQAPIRYTLTGRGEAPIVVIGPPGMSTRFWVPVLARLENSVRAVVFTYPGLPDDGNELARNEVTFDRCRANLELLLDREGVAVAHFLTWCAGTSLALALHQRAPARVRSLTTIGVRQDGSDEPSAFEQAVRELKSTLDAAPHALRRMLTMMQRLGLLRGPEYFEAQCSSEDRAALEAALCGSDPAEREFLLFGTAAGLSNYLRLFDSFNQQQVALSAFPGALTTIRTGTAAERGSTAGSATSGNSRREVLLPPTQQFLLLERAAEIAAEVRLHLEREPSAAARPGSPADDHTITAPRAAAGGLS